MQIIHSDFFGLQAITTVFFNVQNSKALENEYFTSVLASQMARFLANLSLTLESSVKFSVGRARLLASDFVDLSKVV